MDPQQIANVGMVATGAGAGLSAGGAIGGGFASRDMYNYQAGVARLNEKLDLINAQNAMITGDQQNRQFGINAAAQFGNIRAAQADSGLNVNSGSAVQVRNSQTQLNRLDSSTIRQTAAMTAYNYQSQAVASAAQATAFKDAGANALTAGFLNAGSSILGGVSSVSNMWLKGQQTGLWGAAGPAPDTNSGLY